MREKFEYIKVVIISCKSKDRQKEEEQTTSRQKEEGQKDKQ
jgi:hypothetical protein